MSRCQDVRIDEHVKFSMPEEIEKSAEKTDGNGLERIETDFYSDETVKFSLVEDKTVLKKLNKAEKEGEVITLYRAAQLIDGKLYPPMAAKIEGKFVTPIELGKWEKADEHPELADKNGKFKLDKGNGSSVTAAYNPYIHSSLTPLNDQFSSAYKRPELVTLEIIVPKSELSSGYKAEKAKDSVGMKKWKAGIVQGQLQGKRDVMLSRWDKPVRIMPENEVAEKIAEFIKGTEAVIPTHVVTPKLAEELQKRSVPMLDSIAEVEATGKFKSPWKKEKKTDRNGRERTETDRNGRADGETEEGIVKMSIPEYRLADAPEDLKQFVKDLFMRGEHAKTDISKLSRTFGTIFHYSRKLPSLERMFDRAAEIDDIKHGIANHLYNGDTGREIPLELDA